MKRVQRQEIPISRQNQFCLAAQRHIEELVIPGIPARGDSLSDRNHPYDATKQTQEVLTVVS